MAGSLLLVALAFAAVAIGFRRGMPFNQDGWYYWQGSVSILKGLGYRDFTGAPITAWPPLYSVYLAFWQLVLGVSARTLVISTAFATAAAVGTWSILLAWFARERGRAPKDFLCALAFVSVVLVLKTRSVRSELLLCAVLPLLLLFTLRARASTTPARFLLEASLAGISLLVALLIRNAALAFWPAILAVLVQQRRVSWRMRGAACGLVTLFALPGWYAVQAWLGQLGRHRVRLGGRFEFGEYLLQLIPSIDRHTGPQFLGIPVLILLGLSLWRADAAREEPSESPRLGRAALLYTLVAVCATLALFNLTFVHDKLESRFTLFVTLTIGGLGLLNLSALLPRRWLALALVVIFAAPTLRTIKNTFRGRGPRDPDFRLEIYKGFAPNATTIDPGYVRRAPEPSGELMLVSPPYPRWGPDSMRHQTRRGSS